MRRFLPILLFYAGVVFGQASPYSLNVFKAQNFTGSGQSGAIIQLNGLTSSTSTVGSSYSAGTVTVVGTGLTNATFGLLGSSDNGQTYYPLLISSILAPGTTSTTATVVSNGLFQVNLAGITHIQFVTSGTWNAANLSLVLTASPNAQTSRVSGGGGGPTSLPPNLSVVATDSSGHAIQVAQIPKALIPALSYLVPGSNLSDLTNAATARTNLGLGSAAVQPTSFFAPATTGTGLLKADGNGGFASPVTADIVPLFPAFKGDVTSVAGGTQLTLGSTGITPGICGTAQAYCVLSLSADGRVRAYTTQTYSSTTTTGGGGGAGNPAGANGQFQYNNGGAFGANSSIVLDGAGTGINALRFGGMGSANGYGAASGSGDGFQLGYAAGNYEMFLGGGNGFASGGGYYRSSTSAANPCRTDGGAGHGHNGGNFNYTNGGLTANWLGSQDCYTGFGQTNFYYAPWATVVGMNGQNDFVFNLGYGINYGNSGTSTQGWKVVKGKPYGFYATAMGISEAVTYDFAKTAIGDWIGERHVQAFSGGREDASGEGVEAKYINLFQCPSFVTTLTAGSKGNTTLSVATGQNCSSGNAGGTIQGAGAGRIALRIYSPTLGQTPISGVTLPTYAASGTIYIPSYPASSSWGTVAAAIQGGDPVLGSARSISVALATGSFRSSGVACLVSGNAWQPVSYTSSAASGGAQTLNLLDVRAGHAPNGNIKIYDGDCHYFSLLADGSTGNRQAYVVYGSEAAGSFQWGTSTVGQRGAGDLITGQFKVTSSTAVTLPALTRSAAGVITFATGVLYGNVSYRGQTPTIAGCSDSTFNGPQVGVVNLSQDGSTASVQNATSSAGTCAAGAVLTIPGNDVIQVYEGALILSTEHLGNVAATGGTFAPGNSNVYDVASNEANFASGDTIEVAISPNTSVHGHYEFGQINTPYISGNPNFWIDDNLVGWQGWASIKLNDPISKYVGFGGNQAPPDIITLTSFNGSTGVYGTFLNSSFQPTNSILHIGSQCLPGAPNCSLAPTYFIWDHNGKGLAYNRIANQLEATQFGLVLGVGINNNSLTAPGNIALTGLASSITAATGAFSTSLQSPIISAFFSPTSSVAGGCIFTRTCNFQVGVDNTTPIVITQDFSRRGFIYTAANTEFDMMFAGTSAALNIGVGAVDSQTSGANPLIVSSAFNGIRIGMGSIYAPSDGSVTLARGGVKATTDGGFTLRHLIGNSGTPTAAFNSASGATACSVTGTDVAMTINVTMGASPSAGNLCTVTFNAPYGSAPRFSSPSSLNAVSAAASTSLYAATSTTVYTLSSANALTASGSYQWNVVLVQ